MGNWYAWSIPREPLNLVFSSFIPITYTTHSCFLSNASQLILYFWASHRYLDQSVLLPSFSQNSKRFSKVLNSHLFFFCQVLAGEEGRKLRSRHQEMVKILRTKLLDAGIPAVNMPSHIIPIHVRNTALPFTTSSLSC